MGQRWRTSQIRMNSSTTEAKYIGTRTASATLVSVQTQQGREPLRPRFDLIRHHPAGFDWAKTGSGPAQLALALLAHASGSDELALEHHQLFQHEIIARLPKSAWELTNEQVLQMLRFVSQGTQMQPNRSEPSSRPYKTAIIRAVLPGAMHDAGITARGSGPSTGGAIERAIRNLLRDARLRRRAIANLYIELSVVNAGNAGESHGVEDAQS